MEQTLKIISLISNKPAEFMVLFFKLLKMDNTIEAMCNAMQNMILITKSGRKLFKRHLCVVWCFSSTTISKAHLVAPSTQSICGPVYSFYLHFPSDCYFFLSKDFFVLARCKLWAIFCLCRLTSVF